VYLVTLSLNNICKGGCVGKRLNGGWAVSTWEKALQLIAMNNKMLKIFLTGIVQS
jgi:hypothetical protein